VHVCSRLLREVLCLAGGFAILGANAVDIVWTTLGTHGGGPLSGRFLDLLWKVALALHRRRPHHHALSFAGSVLLVVLLIFWTVLLWLGWFTVFSADPHSLVNAQTHQPASPIERLYFTGYTIATLGNGDFMPASRLWQLLTACAALGGLGTVSMAITFLLNVLPAVVQQRTFAAYVSDLGGSPAKILARAWTGESLDSLNDHLLEVTAMVHAFAEQHLAYPVLHFFHSEQLRTAASVRLASLYELLFLLCYGVGDAVHVAPMVVLPLEDALRGLVSVMQGEFVVPDDNAPAAPQLSVLRELGIPTVTNEDYARAAAASRDSRRFYAGLLQDDGWGWEKVWE
jgi:Ion channel